MIEADDDVVMTTGGMRARAAPTADIGESLELTDENVEMVLDEIRPYLMAGAAPPTTSTTACDLLLSSP